MAWIPSISQLNQQSTLIHVSCAACTKQLQRSAWLCDHCHTSEHALCSVCNQVRRCLISSEKFSYLNFLTIYLVFIQSETNKSKNYKITVVYYYYILFFLYNIVIVIYTFFNPFNDLIDLSNEQ